MSLTIAARTIHARLLKVTCRNSTRRGGQKLQLFRRKNNSGNPGQPTNAGISFSRGEYLFLLDSDDLITKTALEELYPVAKKFDADVVHCEKFYKIRQNNSSRETVGLNAGKYVTEPTLISDNFEERVMGLYKVQFVWNIWSKLIRRDFIIENELKMISGMAQDTLFTCCLVCSAPRYVRVPNIINFYRVVDNSHSHKQDDEPKKFQKWLNALIDGFIYFEKFLSEREFFQKRPDMKYLALEIWVRECCNYLQKIYAKYPSWQFDPLIRHELESVKDKIPLMSFIFSRMNVFNLNLYQMNAHIQKQNQVIQQLQAQIKSLQAK